MHIEAFREYCLAKPGVEESFPFGDTTLVFKVMGKIFALTGLDDELFKVNLKCDPGRAQQVREQFPQIQPGFHMNKKHWNTVEFENGLEESLLADLIDHSYQLVVKSLSKKLRDELAELGN